MAGIYTFLGYLKKLLFVDGQVLKAHHLDKMQDSIASAVKEKVTIEKYDIILDYSKYKYSFIEDFTTDFFKSSLSLCTVDKDYFRLVEGEWVTPLMELPASSSANEIFVFVGKETPIGTDVKVYYRTSLLEVFEEINENKVLSATADKIQIKIKAISSATENAYVNDFALMWR
jgi:hypothetical protein